MHYCRQSRTSKCFFLRLSSLGGVISYEYNSNLMVQYYYFLAPYFSRLGSQHIFPVKVFSHVVWAYISNWDDFSNPLTYYRMPPSSLDRHPTAKTTHTWICLQNWGREIEKIRLSFYLLESLLDVRTLGRREGRDRLYNCVLRTSEVRIDSTVMNVLVNI